MQFVELNLGEELRIGEAVFAFISTSHEERRAQIGVKAPRSVSIRRGEDHSHAMIGRTYTFRGTR